MDGSVERLIDATGVSVPLAARIICMILDSGASQIEADVALSIVRSAVNLLPTRLVQDGVGAPELHPPQA
jgi:hypothetical protein